MVVCAVFNCKSNSDKKIKRNLNDPSFGETKFFRFPKNKKISKIWIQRCSRKDKFNILTSYICSKHFLKEHYARNLQHELLNYSPKNSRKLKEDAVPTENLHCSINCISSESISERSERYERKKLQETVSDMLRKDNKLESTEIESIDCVDIVTNECEHQVGNSKRNKSTNTEVLNESNNSKSPTKEKLRKENKILMKKCYLLQQENDAIKKIFTWNQRRIMAKKGERIKWDVEDISGAISIYSSSPKTYRLLLKKNYPLPAVSTLKNWVSKLKSK